MSREVSLRIPKKLIIKDENECIWVSFPDGEQLLMGLMMELTNEDKSKCTGFKVTSQGEETN